MRCFHLKNRTQTIQIGEHLSTKLISPCGVPQGSVRGPLLFLLYINDIHLSSDKLKFYLFTDDTNILYDNKNLKAIEQTVNAELNNVHDWSTTNRLTLNIQKKKILIFCSRQKKNAFFSTTKKVLMGVPNCQLTTSFSANCQLTTSFLANCQLTTNFSYLLTFIISQR